MRKLTQLTMSGLLMLAMIFTLNHCSAESSENENSLAKDVMDTITTTIAENLAEATIITDREKSISADTTTNPEENKIISDITDFKIIDSKLYAVFQNGMVIYDFDNKNQSVIRTKEVLSAVINYQGQIYVGGDYLYQLKDETLEYIDDYDSHINCLYEYNSDLLVGTEDGLFQKGLMGKEKLFDENSISVITSSNDGLWVGTYGNGLYYYDGDIFKKRYLLRDTSMFDYINTLDFNHNHLYVGSSNGLHIFDGGRWATYTQKEGLPGEEVISVDASDWVVYVATDEGVVSFFNEEIKPVEKLFDKRGNKIAKRGQKLILATDYEGILTKSGKSLKTLVQPLEDMNLDLLSVFF